MNYLEIAGAVAVIVLCGYLFFVVVRFFVDLYEDVRDTKWQVKHIESWREINAKLDRDTLNTFGEKLDQLYTNNNTNVHNIIDISERMNKAEEFISASKEIINEDTRLFDEFNDEIESINERLDELCITEKK